MPTHALSLLAAYPLTGVALFLATDGPRRADQVQREVRRGRALSVAARVVLLVAIVLIMPVEAVIRAWRFIA